VRPAIDAMLVQQLERGALDAVAHDRAEARAGHLHLASLTEPVAEKEFSRGAATDITDADNEDLLEHVVRDSRIPDNETRCVTSP
jgi:hypothetical protein